MGNARFMNQRSVRPEIFLRGYQKRLQRLAVFATFIKDECLHFNPQPYLDMLVTSQQVAIE